MLISGEKIGSHYAKGVSLAVCTLSWQCGKTSKGRWAWPQHLGFRFRILDLGFVGFRVFGYMCTHLGAADRTNAKGRGQCGRKPSGGLDCSHFNLWTTSVSSLFGFRV